MTLGGVQAKGGSKNGALNGKVNGMVWCDMLQLHHFLSVESDPSLSLKPTLNTSTVFRILSWHS